MTGKLADGLRSVRLMGLGSRGNRGTNVGRQAVHTRTGRDESRSSRPTQRPLRAARAGDRPRTSSSAWSGFQTPRPSGLIPRLGSWWFFGKIVGLVLVVGALWTMERLITSPNFEATSVMTSGNDLVPAEEIVQTLDIGRPNIFWIRSRQLAMRLEQLPAIASATIRPSLSGNIFVNVAERQPVLVWDSVGQQVLADAEGTALREGLRDLPVLYGDVGGPIPIGGRLDFSAVQVIQAVAPRLRDLGLEEGRLEWETNQGVSVTGEGARVIFGSADQIEAKLNAYQAIRHRLDQGRISAQLIDVRSLDRPYFR